MIELDTAEAVLAWVRSTACDQPINWREDVRAITAYLAECVRLRQAFDEGVKWANEYDTDDVSVAYLREAMKGDNHGS